MTIDKLIEREGGPTAFSRRTGIPLRTVENWKSGARKCADYWVRILTEWLDNVEKEGTQ
jgi:DNA-binding transcriptional regulator YiaG